MIRCQSGFFAAGCLCDFCLRYVFKPTLAEGKNSIISRTMGSKLVKMVYKAFFFRGEGWSFAGSDVGEEYGLDLPPRWNRGK